MTATGGGARQRPKQSALAVYRRHCVVKIAYNRQKGKTWRERARYLTREHAQTPGARGIGFDAEHDQIDMVAIVDAWQKQDDPLLWRFIISPDDADRIDLREHVRELAANMERDLGTRLEWTAIDHHPETENHHVHMLVRGVRDDGRELELDRDYIATGIRDLSQSLIERDLGPRQEHEMLAARERGIEANNWTDIDRALQYRQDANGVVAYPGPPRVGQDRMRQEIERLDYLERLSLASRIGESSWRLSPDHEQKLRELQRDRDIIKRLERERQQGLERDVD
ncbi:MAG: relaxase/mobilization nuclease domain-containing protein [Acidobacteria bacterium]|nr:relaxase/mobilization nuclease domain-containing protein [Acidobacteriota bacterium]